MSAVVRSGAEDPRWSDGTCPDPEADFGCMCLLLLLDERPATGAELCFRLRRLGLVEDGTDPAAVEELMRALERAGLVQGDDDDRGGDRVYRLTAGGAERLGIAADDLRSTQILLDRFLARCGERIVL